VAEKSTTFDWRNRADIAIIIAAVVASGTVITSGAIVAIGYVIGVPTVVFIRRPGTQESCPSQDM
jgi:uncharacterized membrane protein